MNRKERRNYEKKYGKVSAMQKYRNDAIEQGRMQAVNIILTMVAYTIDYKLNLDKDTLQNLLESILLNIDSYRTGQLTTNDFITIQNELKEKGIII